MRSKLLLVLLLLSIATPAFAAYGPNNEECWTNPTTNTDGTPLTDLAGNRLYAGKASGAYTIIKDVVLSAMPGGRCLAGEVGVLLGSLGMTTGTWYIAVTAYNSAGTESGYSNEVTVPFDAASPKSPTNAVR